MHSIQRLRVNFSKFVIQNFINNDQNRQPRNKYLYRNDA